MMANPSRDRYEPAEQSHGSASFNGVHMNGNSFVAVEDSGTVLHHNSGISMDWNAEEQAILERGLAKLAGHANLIRYAKIAALLPNKTVRDVALRVRWMIKKENSRKRKEENGVAKKSKDRKEKVIDPSGKSAQLAVRPGLSPYAQAVGSANGQLLQHNAQVLQHIYLNLNAYQTHENVPLFCKARDNILKVMNNMGEVPEAMKQMPDLPKLNVELANYILPMRDVPNATTNVNYDRPPNM